MPFPPQNTSRTVGVPLSPLIRRNPTSNKYVSMCMFTQSKAGQSRPTGVFAVARLQRLKLSLHHTVSEGITGTGYKASRNDKNHCVFSLDDASFFTHSCHTIVRTLYLGRPVPMRGYRARLPNGRDFNVGHAGGSFRVCSYSHSQPTEVCTNVRSNRPEHNDRRSQTRGHIFR